MVCLSVCVSRGLSVKLNAFSPVTSDGNPKARLCFVIAKMLTLMTLPITVEHVANGKLICVLSLLARSRFYHSHPKATALWFAVGICIPSKRELSRNFDTLAVDFALSHAARKYTSAFFIVASPRDFFFFHLLHMQWKPFLCHVESVDWRSH